MPKQHEEDPAGLNHPLYDLLVTLLEVEQVQAGNRTLAYSPAYMQISSCLEETSCSLF